jgi:hypothetical protein
MNKKTATKKVARKTTKKVNSGTSKKVAKNIGIMPNGKYRARKTVDGTPRSKVCNSITAAKTWLKNLA